MRTGPTATACPTGTTRGSSHRMSDPPWRSSGTTQAGGTMSAAKRSSHDDFQLLTDELIAQVKALVDIGDQTSGLVSSAQRLAEHQPLLGTAPPAMHLSSRLRDAAGPA